MNRLLARGMVLDIEHPDYGELQQVRTAIHIMGQDVELKPGPSPWRRYGRYLANAAELSTRDDRQAARRPQSYDLVPIRKPMSHS